MSAPVQPVPSSARLERLLSVGVVVACFALYATWVLVIPFDAAPDEAMRYRLVRYISENHVIPSGLDPATRDDIWGTSYAFEPILAALVAAFLRSAASFFTSDPHLLAIAARFASVVFGTGTVALCILISRRILQGVWRWLFVALVAFLPQFVFLSSYLNSDSLAIFSTALIIYAWLRGLRDGWRTTTAALLGLGISVCLLSYFTAYGFVLLSAVVYFADRFRGWRRAPVDQRRTHLRQTLGQVAVIVGVVLVLAAWWFVRNAYLYDGDFLGLRTSGEQGRLYGAEFAKPGASSALGRGWTLGQMLFHRGWFVMSAMSSVGVFGYMKVRMPDPVYAVYGIITVVGILATLPALGRWLTTVRRHGGSDAELVEPSLSMPGASPWARRLLQAALLVAIPIPVALSIYHSYTQDYQPQGRYILPMLLPVAYLVTKGFAELVTRYVSSRTLRLAVFAVLCAWPVVATLLALVGVVIPRYRVHA